VIDMIDMINVINELADLSSIIGASFMSRKRAETFTDMFNYRGRQEKKTHVQSSKMKQQ
jgi:hypothetical protein